MLDLMLSLGWIGLIVSVLSLKKKKLFPEEMALAERKSAVRVAPLFWGGFCLGLISRALVRPGQPQWIYLAGAVCGMAALGLFLLAGSKLAFKRGRSWWWGLLGSVGPIGLLVILLLGQR